MGYSFKHNESVSKGVRRIAREQLDSAIEELSDGGGSPHGGVHKARQRLKKIRSLLRLVRGQLDVSYRKENGRLREMGRLLSPLRDAEAMIESFDALRAHFAEDLTPQSYDAIHGALVERQRRIARAQPDPQKSIADVVEELRKARQRARKWTLNAKGFEALEPGFRRMYGGGRAAMAEAGRQPTDENYHEWRKRVKDHWYHVRLLKKMWPVAMEARESALKELSDLLGDDHDLVVLRGAFPGEFEAYCCREPIDALLGQIERRKAELRAAMQPLGSRIYAGSPRSQARPMRAWWKAWNRESSSKSCD